MTPNNRAAALPLALLRVSIQCLANFLLKLGLHLGELGENRKVLLALNRALFKRTPLQTAYMFSDFGERVLGDLHLSFVCTLRFSLPRLEFAVWNKQDIIGGVAKDMPLGILRALSAALSMSLRALSSLLISLRIAL